MNVLVDSLSEISLIINISIEDSTWWVLEMKVVYSRGPAAVEAVTFRTSLGVRFIILAFMMVKVVSSFQDVLIRVVHSMRHTSY